MASELIADSCFVDLQGPQGLFSIPFFERCQTKEIITFAVIKHRKPNIDFEMEDQEKPFRREELFSRAIRAGKRTYFFDVKATRGEEQYLTITESKRRFSNDQGRFFYEKHKLFLYKEDFEKFVKGLQESIQFIETGELPDDYGMETEQNIPPVTDVRFEDLDKVDDEI